MSDAPDRLGDGGKYDWIDRVVKVAAAFGFNPVALRWRLMRWQDKRERESEGTFDRARHVAYEHAICPECGRVAPRGTKECAGCGAALGTRAGQVIRRAGGLAPVTISASAGLGALILLCFVRQVMASEGRFMGFTTLDVIALGAHLPALERAGEWWRLGTAIFLHGGILHLGFNLMALSQVGVVVEDVFGRGRTAFLFMATGILAFAPGMLLGSVRPSVGASGAIMGLIGVAAGWGHRDGTSIGHAVRNAMIKWLLMTTLIGLMMPVDHLAHVGGFVAGAAFGYLGRPLRRGGAASGTDLVLGLVGAALALACVVLVWTRATPAPSPY